MSVLFTTHCTALRRGLTLLLATGLAACGATWGGEKMFAVNAEDVRPNDPLGARFTVEGHVGYERIWNAAIAAMSNGMTIIESHKPSGVIKAREGAAPGGKIVAIFITPTAPTATSYRIDTSSIRPIGVNAVNGRGWEPRVIDNFHAALGAKGDKAPVSR